MSNITINTNVIETPVFTHERGVAQIAKDFTFDKHETVTLKNNKLTAPELGAFMLDTMTQQNSVNVRLANLLRLARDLQPVEVQVRDKHGDLTGAIVKESAFNWLKEKLKTNSATEGVFQNMFQLVEALDFIFDNEKLIGKVSPFTVKNALGKLRDFKVLPKPEKGVEYKKGALALTLTAESDPTAIAIVAALECGFSQKKLALAIEDSEGKKRAKVLADEAARKAAEAAKNPAPPIVNDKGAAPAEGTTPPVNNTPTGAPAGAPAGEAPKATQTPEMVLADIFTICGNWELAMKQGASREDMRKVCADKVKELALLAGFKCIKAE